MFPSWFPNAHSLSVFFRKVHFPTGPRFIHGALLSPKLRTAVRSKAGRVGSVCWSLSFKPAEPWEAEGATRALHLDELCILVVIICQCCLLEIPFVCIKMCSGGLCLLRVLSKEPASIPASAEGALRPGAGEPVLEPSTGLGLSTSPRALSASCRSQEATSQNVAI